VGLFEGICQNFDIVHDDQVVRDVQVTNVALSDDFGEEHGRLVTHARIREVAHLQTLGLEKTLSNPLAGFIAHLVVVVHSQLSNAEGSGQQLEGSFTDRRLDHVLSQVKALKHRLVLNGSHDVFGLVSNLVVFETQNSKTALVVQHLGESINGVVVNLVIVQVEFFKLLIVDHGL